MTVLLDNGPRGNPAGVRAAVSRLTAVAHDLANTSRVLTSANQEAEKAWDGPSRRLFSTLTAELSNLVRGASDIASGFGAALDRYAHTLDICQHEFRSAVHRVEAATRAADASTVALGIGQARQATAVAANAARELAARARSLTGTSNREVAILPATSRPPTSFVSYVHGVAGVSTGDTGPITPSTVTLGTVQNQATSVIRTVVPDAGAVMIRPGTPSRTVSIAMIDMNESPAFLDWKASLDRETEAKVKALQIQAANTTPAPRGSTPALEKSIANTTLFAGMAITQAWTAALRQSQAEQTLREDFNYSGQIGDVTPNP